MKTIDIQRDLFWEDANGTPNEIEAGFMAAAIIATWPKELLES